MSFCLSTNPQLLSCLGMGTWRKSLDASGRTRVHLIVHEINQWFTYKHATGDSKVLIVTYSNDLHAVKGLTRETAVTADSKNNFSDRRLNLKAYIVR